MVEAKLDLGASLDIASGKEVRDSEKRITDIFRKSGARPIYRSIPCSAQVTAARFQPIILNVGGPSAGKIWDVRQLVVLGADDRSGPAIASNQVAGGSSSNTSLPAGASLSTVMINSVNVAAAVGTTISITGSNIAGGIQLDVGMGTNGSNLQFSFPTPIAAANATTAITVTVPTITSGPAYSVTLIGTYPAPWYVSFNDSYGLGNLLVPGNISTVPSSFVPSGTKSIFLHDGEELTCLVYGKTVGEFVTAIARVAEWDDTAIEAMSI